MPILVSTLAGALAGMLILSRILRWVLSWFLKGSVLSIASDLLAIGAGVAAAYKLQTGDPTIAVIGYVVAGLAILLVDIVLDLRRARSA